MTSKAGLGHGAVEPCALDFGRARGGNDEGPVWFDAAPVFTNRPAPLVLSDHFLKGVERMILIHQHVRRARRTPTQGNLSFGVQIAKKGNKKGAEATRMLHCLCPYWSAFARSLLNDRGSELATPPWCYGGLAGKRREHAMILTRLVAWKLQAAGLSFFAKSHDMRSAFHSGLHSDLLQCAAERLEKNQTESAETLGKNAELLQQRRTESVVFLQAAGEHTFLNNKMGGFMGDQNEPEMFMDNFHRALVEWLRLSYKNNDRHLVATSPVFPDSRQNASIYTFLDDIFRFMVFSRGAGAKGDLPDERSAIAVSNGDSACLNKALAQRRYAQNTGKAEIVALVGRRALRHTLAATDALAGTLLIELKHVGGYFHPSLKNTSEIDARIAAGNMGWMQLQHFWFAKSPWGAKRLLFISAVLSHLLSVTSYVLGALETKRLERSTIKKLRAMLAGKAHAVNDDGAHTAWKAREIWRYWRLAPPAVELLIQRLVLFFGVLRNKEKHHHFITVFFGTLRCESYEREAAQTLDCEGCLACDAGSPAYVQDAVVHPWARQLFYDLLEVARHPEGEAFAQEWRPRSFTRLFSDDGLADLLLRFDPAIFRAQFLTQRWAPATAEVADQIAPLDEVVPLADPAVEDKFQCMIAFDGRVCGDCFGTLAGLRIHQRHSKKPAHTVINILRSLVLTNKCPSCETIFPSKQQAKNHLETSWLQSRCLKGNTAHPHKEVVCDLAACPLCAQTFDDVSAFQRHIRSHIPLTPSGNALRVVAAKAVSQRAACLRGAPPKTSRGARAQSAPRSAKASLLPRIATATRAVSAGPPVAPVNPAAASLARALPDTAALANSAGASSARLASTSAAVPVTAALANSASASSARSASDTAAPDNGDGNRRRARSNRSTGGGARGTTPPNEKQTGLATRGGVRLFGDPSGHWQRILASRSSSRASGGERTQNRGQPSDEGTPGDGGARQRDGGRQRTESEERFGAARPSTQTRQETTQPQAALREENAVPRALVGQRLPCDDDDGAQGVASLPTENSRPIGRSVRHLPCRKEVGIGASDGEGDEPLRRRRAELQGSDGRPWAIPTGRPDLRPLSRSPRGLGELRRRQDESRSSNRNARHTGGRSSRSVGAVHLPLPPGEAQGAEERHALENCDRHADLRGENAGDPRFSADRGAQARPSTSDILGR